MFPGFDGGAEWGGSAFDPATGVILCQCERYRVDERACAPNTPTATLGRQTYVTPVRRRVMATT